MSRVRVHNFSISLDGLATGEGPTLDAPFNQDGLEGLDLELTGRQEFRSGAVALRYGVV